MTEIGLVGKDRHSKSYKKMSVSKFCEIAFTSFLSSYQCPFTFGK